MPLNSRPSAANSSSPSIGTGWRKSPRESRAAAEERADLALQSAQLRHRGQTSASRRKPASRMPISRRVVGDPPEIPARGRSMQDLDRRADALDAAAAGIAPPSVKSRGSPAPPRADPRRGPSSQQTVRRARRCTATSHVQARRVSRVTNSSRRSPTRSIVPTVCPSPSPIPARPRAATASDRRPCASQQLRPERVSSIASMRCRARARACEHGPMPGRSRRAPPELAVGGSHARSASRSAASPGDATRSAPAI